MAKASLLREGLTRQGGDRWLGAPRSRPEILLVDPIDRSKLRRSARLSSVLTVVVVVLMSFAVIGSVLLTQSAGEPSGLALGALLLCVLGFSGGLLATRWLTIKPRSPLTRGELDSYPGHIAAPIRFGLAGLMPRGIGPNECRPTDVALDAAAEDSHRKCWAFVSAARQGVH